MENDENKNNKGTVSVKSVSVVTKKRPMLKNKDKRYMVRVLETLYLPSGIGTKEITARVEDACIEMREIAPKDGLERILAAEMLSIHQASMECLRRAALENQTKEIRESNLNQAAKLAGLFIRQMETLDKHRGKGQQKVTVEHVHVESGGQAVVGSVHTGGRALESSPENQDWSASTTTRRPNARQTETLDKHREKGEQEVAVEQVHVESGAEAVVEPVPNGAGTLKSPPEDLDRPASTTARRPREPLRTRRVCISADTKKA
jgi:hypothetical protein